MRVCREDSGRCREERGAELRLSWAELWLTLAVSSSVQLRLASICATSRCKVGRAQRLRLDSAQKGTVGSSAAGKEAESEKSPERVSRHGNSTLRGRSRAAEPILCRRCISGPCSVMGLINTPYALFGGQRSARRPSVLRSAPKMMIVSAQIRDVAAMGTLESGPVASMDESIVVCNAYLARYTTHLTATLKELPV